MRESEKEKKILLKRYWERRKGIRNEMSLFGKIYEIIFILTIIIILVYIFYLSHIYEVEEYFLIFLYLCFIILPLLIIFSIINKKALKKYNIKVKKKRINFCIYCNGKIEVFSNVCPYYRKKLDYRHDNVVEANKIERKFKKKSAENESVLLEQEEVISFSQKSFALIFIGSTIVMIIVFAIIVLFLLGARAMISTIIGGSIILLCYIIVVYFNVLLTIISKFTISKHAIKLIIEKQVYFQIIWADIKDIEIFKITFKGYFLKMNTLQNYELIGLKFCDFNKNKQEKIIEALFKFSEKLNKPISIKKAFGPFIDDIGMKELYDKIYNFARSQRFILKRNY